MSEEVKFTIDGQEVSAPKGMMLIEAADRAGIHIPRFCYHKKLSIAANCRMCLVEMTKARKPMPACATPVAEGMEIFTRSEAALAAQKSTMEFLLINHPLDCPICDQGGECELQDISLGYGKSASRYAEEKRVVFDKDIGPLIATEMTRCIHCTRCVRFGEEIAGLREMGATGRGEKVRIGTYIEKSVVSEVSGNVIDLCPVGALTAKPSRFSGRSWEFIQHASIAPHDAWGSNIYIHTSNGKVKRVVPKDNEAINEVWLSDRDRFSYEALYSDDRALKPMVKKEGTWQVVDWEQALTEAIDILKTYDSEQIAGLAAPHSTLEELYLFQKLLRGVFVHNIDHRLKQLDFSDQNHAPTMPWLGQDIADIENLQAILLVGSNIRKEIPLAALRIRKACTKGAKVMALNPRHFDFNHVLTNHLVVHPAQMVDEFAGITKAILEQKQSAIPSSLAKVSVTDAQKAIAENLLSANNASIILGYLANSHPYASKLRYLAALIAQHTAIKFALLPEASNSAGACLAGVLPHRGVAGNAVTQVGLNTQEMFDSPRKAYVLLNVEPELDTIQAAKAKAALSQAEKVIIITPYVSDAMKEYADIILPMAAFAENAGTYVNAEGYWQSFKAATPPLGESRPAWKILRVMANLLRLKGFDYMSAQDVLQEVKANCREVRLDNTRYAQQEITLPSAEITLVRAGDINLYQQDNIVRRASALQAAEEANLLITLNPQDAEKLNLASGDTALVKQQDIEFSAQVSVDAAIVENTVWIPMATPLNFDAIEITKMEQS